MSGQVMQPSADHKRDLGRDSDPRQRNRADREDSGNSNLGPLSAQSSNQYSRNATATSSRVALTGSQQTIDDDFDLDEDDNGDGDSAAGKAATGRARPTALPTLASTRQWQPSGRPAQRYDSDGDRQRGLTSGSTKGIGHIGTPDERRTLPQVFQFNRLESPPAQPSQHRQVRINSREPTSDPDDDENDDEDDDDDDDDDGDDDDDATSIVTATARLDLGTSHPRGGTYTQRSQSSSYQDQSAIRQSRGGYRSHAYADPKTGRLTIWELREEQSEGDSGRASGGRSIKRLTTTQRDPRTDDYGYRKLKDPDGAFRIGLVFETLLVPPPSSTLSSVTPITAIAPWQFGTRMRRFVVIQENTGDGSRGFRALPILTYTIGGVPLGVAAPGVLKAHHSIIHTILPAPQPSRGELPRPLASGGSERPMLPNPIEVQSVDRRFALDPMARLNYGSIHTFPYEQEVKVFGRVVSLQALEYQFRVVWGQGLGGGSGPGGAGVGEGDTRSDMRPSPQRSRMALRSSYLQSGAAQGSTADTNPGSSSVPRPVNARPGDASGSQGRRYDNAVGADRSTQTRRSVREPASALAGTGAHSGVSSGAISMEEMDAQIQQFVLDGWRRGRTLPRQPGLQQRQSLAGNAYLRQQWFDRLEAMWDEEEKLDSVAL